MHDRNQVQVQIKNAYNFIISLNGTVGLHLLINKKSNIELFQYVNSQQL